MGGFQDLESMQWRWFWLEGCVNFLKWVVSGNCNDSPTPCTPLNNDVLLLTYPGIFFLQNFSVVELLIPITSGCLLQPKAVPYLDPCSKPHFPTPPLQYKTHNSGQVVSGRPHRLRVQFLIYTAFHRLSTEFSFDLLKVPFCLS